MNKQAKGSIQTSRQAFEAPPKPSLDSYLTSDDSFQSAFFRALSSIASCDGYVNLAEYVSLGAIIERSEQSALAAQIILFSVENPRDVKAALQDLLNSSEKVDLSIREAAWNTAKDLLLLQGEKSRDFARQLAKSLKIKVLDSDLQAFPTSSASTLWQSVSRQSARVIKGGQILPLAEKCIKVTGNRDVATLIGNYLDGQIAPAKLQAQIMSASADIANQLVEFESQLNDAEQIESISRNYLTTANQLYEQIAQRLAIVGSRVQYERQSFDEDIEDAIHDAGNSVELEIADRLKTDRWSLAKVWQSIGRSTFGKELERRVGRIVGRRESQLNLMKDELRNFQNDLYISRLTILHRQHHAQFAKLMPSLRIGARIMNTLDKTAEGTLVAGAVATAGAAGAVGVWGTALVFPVIAPVVPYVGGALLVAGLFKLLADSSEDRKEKEIRDKREAFENELRKQLEAARESYFSQLDALAKEYLETANAFITPVLLEAEAASKLNNYQVRVARKVLAEARNAIAELNASIAELNHSV